MEKARDSDEIYTTPTPVPPSDATWLQVQKLEVCYVHLSIDMKLL